MPTQCFSFDHRVRNPFAVDEDVRVGQEHLDDRDDANAVATDTARSIGFTFATRIFAAEIVVAIGAK
jgi:hypothetical protein